jgi:hypothetical protein
MDMLDAVTIMATALGAEKAADGDTTYSARE